MGGLEYTHSCRYLRIFNIYMMYSSNLSIHFIQSTSSLAKREMLHFSSMQDTDLIGYTKVDRQQKKANSQMTRNMRWRWKMMERG